ncbi:MAG TPA: asparagine synthase (glutamine-hydrolyzing) [Vicinamibacterales bacterium]
MCGICGKVYRDPARRVRGAQIEAMRDAMVTRGPDAGGIHLDRHAGMGHRRLSIIDLEASAQPMSNEDGKVWIVYNGEVYNFVELREELLARGHRFRTSGDTEVIVHLYEDFGADCVKKLRGMFAFAIWDARTDTLLLARDRIGIKPLYYTVTDQALLFGSELKALVADDQLRAARQIDAAAVHSYLSFLCVPDPASIYRGVYKLPAAHTLTFHAGTVRLQRYWDVEFRSEERVADDATWERRLLEHMREAVRVRLVADVPLGAFLSGGIDSSTVVALMAAAIGRPVKTFSIGFSQKAFDEASDARRVADHIGTDHTELRLTPTHARDLVPQLLEHFDEPFADASAIPTYFVSKLAREQVTVVLSGDGGDELFGGYPWRQARPFYQRQLSRLPVAVRSGLRRLTGALPAHLRGANYLRRIDIPYERYILDAMAVFDESDRQTLYSPGFLEMVRGIDPYQHHLPNLAGRADRAWEARMMEYDLKTYLPNDVLTKVDRMTMRASLEARVPLLDHHLVEFAGTMPSRLKIQGKAGKRILKRVMAPYLPASVLQKPKQGFSVPLGSWLRTSLRDDILDTLRGGNDHGFFDRTAVERLSDEFFRGDDSRAYQVWTLYAFELWYRNVYGAARHVAVA